jgi:NADP-dependent 3-hydroxy acid dehydrogenase YdfG
MENDMKKFKGIALITGATGDIGWEVVAEGISRGYFIVAFGRNQNKLLALKDKYQDAIETVSLDLSDESHVEKTLKDIYQKYPKVDVLINGAGLFRWDYEYGKPTVDENRLAAIEDLMEQNYTSKVRLMRYFEPLYCGQKVNIIDVSSWAAKFPLLDLITWPEWGYIFSMRAVSARNLELQKQSKPTDTFRYRLIEPKLIDTPKMRENMKDDSEGRRPVMHIKWEVDAQKPAALAKEIWNVAEQK